MITIGKEEILTNNFGGLVSVRSSPFDVNEKNHTREEKGRLLGHFEFFIAPL